MNLRLRAATPDDHTLLSKLNRLAYEGVVTRQFGIWDERAQRERFASKLQRAAFQTVELAGCPIAAVWSSEDDDHVYLHELLVLPEFQNRGVGSWVLHGELARARAAGKPMRLHTLLPNRAQELYKRHGFVETGRSDVYVDMDWTSVSLPPPSGDEG